MSGRREIKRELQDIYLDAVEGCGNSITFKLRGYRETKAGTTEVCHLTLKACRYSVKQLLAGLKGMHQRDRERIQSELARIDQESNALVRT